jgi:hypothetical protein
MTQQSFEEKRSLLKQNISKIKNKKLLEKMFIQNTTIDKQIESVEKIIKLDNSFDKIESNSLKEKILNKIDETPIERIPLLIENSNKVYNAYKSNNENVALWKVILSEIRKWWTITPLMQQNILNILKTTPYDVANDLWLDLSALQSWMALNIKSKREEISWDTKKIINDYHTLEKEIKSNLAEHESIVWGIKSSINELNELINNTPDENIKKSLELNKKSLEENLKEEEISFWSKRELLKQKINDNNKDKRANEFLIDELKKYNELLWEAKKIEFQFLKEQIKSDVYIDLSDAKQSSINEYNENQRELESNYYQMLEGEAENYFWDIMEYIDNEDYDVDEIKRNIEEEAQKTYQIESNFEAEIKEKFSEIDSKIPTNVDIQVDWNILDMAEKLLEQKSAILKAWTEKLDIVYSKEKELEGNKINKKDLERNVGLAVSNIQKKISTLNKEFDDYSKNWEYNEKVAKDFEYKIKWYQDLVSKLKDSNTSLVDKHWLVSLLWKWDWLWKYINHRSKNYGYNLDHIWKELKASVKWEYEDWKLTELYKKWLEEQKYSLVEQFAKLKWEIPKFENISLNDNLYHQAQLLWISDDATLLKIEKLKKLQHNIKNLDLSTYTKHFIDWWLEEIRLKKENEIKVLNENKKEELRRIDRLPYTDEEKDIAKSEYLDIYEQKLAKLEDERTKINNEIITVRDYWKDYWHFSKSEMKDISNNMNLFGIVSNVDEYSDIIAWISDDILEWNTEFINFENYKHIKSDFYTTWILNDVVWQQISTLKRNIELIWDDKTKTWLKNSLIKEKIRLEWLEKKLYNWEILEDDVLNLLSPNELYKLSLQKKNNELLEKINSPDILPNDLELYTNELEKNLEIIKNINEWNISDELKSQIIENEKSYNIDRELIAKEIEDWFNNSNTINDNAFSRYKWKWRNVFDNAKEKINWINIEEIKWKWKKVKETLFWNDNFLTESKESRDERHRHIDKYTDAVVSTWFAYMIILFFKSFQLWSTFFSRIHIYLAALRTFIEDKRQSLFFIILVILLIIVTGADKEDLSFININTNLYSIGKYTNDSWNIVFSNFLDWKIDNFFYKSNVFLFFLFLVVLYKIIIEFIYKYIDILKNPTIWISNMFLSMWKLIIFFLFMWVIFKLNTFII